MEAQFSLIDVFSERPFGGNQLAVFPRAEGLSDEVMQQLAREFNFAESTLTAPLAVLHSFIRYRIDGEVRA